MRRLQDIQARFGWRLWQYTGAHENLFDLDEQALEFFKMFVNEAWK